MNNPRVTSKERNLIKGAIRRVFSRSDLRRAVVALTVVPGLKDPARPRVTRWSTCQSCKQPTPTYKLEVDHKDPVVPLDTTLEDMTWDTVVDRIFCEQKGLWAICRLCHNEKSKAENAERRKLKKEKKDGKQ